MNVIEENQTYRFQILWEVYRQTNADIDTVVDIQYIAGNLGINNRNFQMAYKYLYMQDLIQLRNNQLAGNNNSNYQASISHKGIKAIEEVYRNQNKPTEFFPTYREMMM